MAPPLDDDEADTTALLLSQAGSPSLSPLKTSGFSDALMLEAEMASTWADEEEALSREKMQMIKARTMYEMVEEIQLPGGQCKLLFLTNVQAELLASNDDSLEKMLNALEVPTPQLVINLLHSTGFSEHVNEKGAEGDFDVSSQDAGIVSCRAPFTTPEQERAAEQRIDGFMADVLIPLAAQTHAVILTPPFSVSILTRSLMRMYAVQRSKWIGRPPFTILAMGTSIDIMYCNPDLNACWREVRKQSRAWKSRDKKLLDLVQQLNAKPDGSLPSYNLDFDPNCMCIITTDAIEPKKESKFDKGPFNALLNHLVRYLGSSLPSLTIKTGFGDLLTLAEHGQAMSCIDIALDAAQGGSSVLFLDVRERPLVKAADRVALIDAAKAALEEHCDALLAVGLAESFSCCSIAYMHRALISKPDANTSDDEAPKLKTLVRNYQGAEATSESARLALHQAIQVANSEEGAQADKEAQGMKRATPEQASALATWLANRYFKDSFELLTDKAEREARGETYETLYKERIIAMQVWTEALFTSSNFHQINLCDRDEAKRVVGQLVRLDRLPRSNPLEGLLLLQDAWKSHDIAEHLAEYYKFISKFVFLLQLAIVWSVTFAETMSLETSTSPTCNQFGNFTQEERSCLIQRNAELEGKSTTYGQMAFVLAAVATVLISIDGLLNAKMRWRQLRAGAGSLDSMIWCYRTRVGAFELNSSDPSSRGPETSMRMTLITWRRGLMTGGDLQLSGLSRVYSANVYKHHQFPESGPLSAEDVDDFYSPVQPHKYIELRILPSIAFYEQRTPWYAAQRNLVKVLLLLCALASTLLSHYQLAVYVIAITSSAAALTSWQEYTDVSSKTERYTRAAFELQNVLSWWKSLSEVEKANTSIIAQLIHSAEGIISEERLAWMSTANQTPLDSADMKGDEEQGGKKPASDSLLYAC